MARDISGVCGAVKDGSRRFQARQGPKIPLVTGLLQI